MSEFDTIQQLVKIVFEQTTKGKKKYGGTVDESNKGPEYWIDHTVRELVDGAVYLLRLKKALQGGMVVYED